MGISELVRQKGKGLVRDGRVFKEIETSKRIHFVVYSESEHSVIFDKGRKEWSCDCQFFTLRERLCSHILACKLYLSKLSDGYG